MITSSGNVIFKAGALDVYTTPTITVVPQVFQRSGDIICTLHIADTGSPTVTSALTDYRTTKTATDAKTGTGSGDFAKFMNALEQVLKDDLFALNPSVTFTIV